MSISNEDNVYREHIEFIELRPDLKMHYDEMMKDVVYSEIVIEEILRQLELRMTRHMREYGCYPFASYIQKEDLIKAKVYLNTVEEWVDLWDENKDAMYREDD